MEMRERKRRCHAISVARCSGVSWKNCDSLMRPIGVSRDSLGMISPAEVFLQLYRTHPVIADAQDLPLHVPKIQVFGTVLCCCRFHCSYMGNKLKIKYINK